MARRCVLSGKGVLVGHNVSHANNKTKRRYLPNVQSRRLYSEALGETVRLKIALNTLRTIDKHGGLDGYLLRTRDTALPERLRQMKKRIAERQSGTDPAAEAVA